MKKFFAVFFIFIIIFALTLSIFIRNIRDKQIIKNQYEQNEQINIQENAEIGDIDVRKFMNLTSNPNNMTNKFLDLSFDDKAMINFYTQISPLKLSSMGFQIWSMPLITLNYFANQGGSYGYFSEYYTKIFKDVVIDYLPRREDLPLLKIGHRSIKTLDELPPLYQIKRKDMVALYRYLYPFLKNDESVFSLFHLNETHNFYTNNLNDENISLVTDDEVIFQSPGLGGALLPTLVVDVASVRKIEEGIFFDVHLASVRLNEDGSIYTDEKGQNFYKTDKIFRYGLIPNKGHIEGEILKLPYRIAFIDEEIDIADKIKIFELKDLILNPEDIK